MPANFVAVLKPLGCEGNLSVLRVSNGESDD